MILLNYRDSRPIYAQISGGLKQQIAADVLRSGDKLESVREMASRLAINPNTIQRAYRDLELEGWIVSVPGKGSFVCGVPGGSEKRPAWEELDTAVSALLSQGVTREQILDHIHAQGGTENAET